MRNRLFVVALLSIVFALMLFGGLGDFERRIVWRDMGVEALLAFQKQNHKIMRKNFLKMSGAGYFLRGGKWVKLNGLGSGECSIHNVVIPCDEFRRYLKDAK